MRKRGWKAAVLALCLLPLLSCGGRGESETVVLISKGDLTVDFWKSVYDGASAAADIYGVNLVLETPSTEENYQEQIALLERVTQTQPDAIVLAASDYTLLTEPVQAVIDSDIPVIMVDSDVDNDDTVAYIGTDNEALGTMLAQSVSDYVSTPGEIGVISFVKDSHTAVLRERGFRNAMAAEGRFTLLDTAYCNSDAALAEELTIALLQAHPDMVAIVALNDPSIEGVCAALDRYPSREIQVFSIDCTPKQVPYIEKGMIDVSLLQNPYQMGYQALEVAYQYLQGDEKQQDIYTDIYAANCDVIFDDLYQQLIFPFS